MVLRFTPMESGIATPLKKIIDAKSVEKNNEKRKVRSSLYASDYGSCQRKVFFQMFPEDFPSEGEIDARVARVFANGNAVHERLGVYLRMEPSLRFVDEVDVPRCELDIHGRCDGIVDQNDQMVIVEFKSINKLDVQEPKVEHVGQVTLYMHQFTMLRSKLREEFGVGEIFDVEQLMATRSSTHKG